MGFDIGVTQQYASGWRKTSGCPLTHTYTFRGKVFWFLPGSTSTWHQPGITKSPLNPDLLVATKILDEKFRRRFPITFRKLLKMQTPSNRFWQPLNKIELERISDKMVNAYEKEYR